MLDFTRTPFFDNHTHRIDVSNRAIEPIELGKAFVHGRDPVHPMDAQAQQERYYNIMNMGVVKVVVNQMAQYFACEATPEAVIQQRNVRTLQDGYGYAKELYTDACVIGEMVDDGAPLGSPELLCFPTKIYRLFQMDPFVRQLLQECGSFAEMKQKFDSGLRGRLAEGFIGVKSHVLELRGQPMIPVEDAQAEACYAQARADVRNAFEDVYLALFQHVLMLTQELHFSVHVHTGCTGNPNDLQTSTDPYVLAPLMRDSRFADANIVLLHCNPPDFGHAAWLTHSYPNVWIDIGWSLPWLALNIDHILEEILSIAPHSKIMIGSGQHNHAEMVWAASRIVKAALTRVLTSKVNASLLCEAQAQEIGEQLLYKNAARLYRLSI